MSSAAPCRSDVSATERFCALSPVPSTLGGGRSVSWSAAHAAYASSHESVLVRKSALARFGFDGLRSLFETMTTSVSG